jgi:hypothetical protein
MVTSESLEKTCAEVSEYSEEKMMGEYDRFFQTQPAVCDFVVELTGDSGQKIQELSLFLSYMVFKAIELSAVNAIGSVTASAIEEAYRDSESWIERISASEVTELQADIASNLQADTEPYLLQYVISELNEPLEDGTDLDDEEKGEVFFLMKTVISSIALEARKGVESQS